MKSLFRHLLFSACCLASIASHAVTADNGLVSVSSDSTSVRGILAVGDDFAVFQDKSLDRASASITIAGIGDMKVETPKVVPLSGKSSVRYRAKDSRTWEDPATGTVYPIRIDIEQDTVYVPFGNSSTTLNLTDDSTWGIWDVIWSSEPAGISGRGSSIVVPDNLAQGHYTVTAAFSENPDWNAVCNVEVIRVNLSPKDILGCEKCLSDVRFTLVDSYCPGGVNWELQSYDSSSGSATISEDGSISLGSSGGEYFLVVSSKVIPHCLDTGTLSYYIPVIHPFSASDYHWLTIEERTDSMYPNEEQYGRYVKWSYDTEPSTPFGQGHFCYVQQVKGTATMNEGYIGAPNYNETVAINFENYIIDSRDANPIYPGGTNFSDSPVPIRASRINEEFHINLKFKTGIYCRKTIDTSLPKTGPVPSNPFDIKEWSLVMRTENGKIIAGETEGGQTE